jgi:peptide/nickel transport system substrate-binding protein
MTEPDPGLFMNQFTTAQLATKENKWQGRNVTRFTHPDIDAAYAAQEGELDPVKRAAYFIKINDVACSNNAVIPVAYRPRVGGVSNKLHVNVSGWDNDLYQLREWYRDA